MKKIYRVAILGLGGRGGDAYGPLLFAEKERFEITSLCDLRESKLNFFQKRFHVSKSNCFLDEADFFKEKRADLLVIATQDADHIRHALKAFSLGYDILLEKPITAKREECIQLLEAQKVSNCRALVCHVLRYAPAFVKAAEILKSGRLGKLVTINALERVTYWHQAHSYVRGNWRNSDFATPMILAKCCHDLDLIQYYAGSKCKSISSVGDLAFFKECNAPKGASTRCSTCKYIDSCEYSAKKVYLQRWIDDGKEEDSWPYNILTQAPLTEEKISDAIQNGPYGQCVFYCDNNVVDHQIVSMTFENGVKAELTMTGFTKRGGRRIHFFCTNGELILDEQNNELRINNFNFLEGSDEVIKMDDLTEHGYSHGGGDYCLINALYDMLEGKTESVTSLDSSIESHLMGICAEESRKENGKLIYLHDN